MLFRGGRYLEFDWLLVGILGGIDVEIFFLFMDFLNVRRLKINSLFLIIFFF